MNIEELINKHERRLKHFREKQDYTKTDSITSDVGITLTKGFITDLEKLKYESGREYSFQCEKCEKWISGNFELGSTAHVHKCDCGIDYMLCY